MAFNFNFYKLDNLSKVYKKIAVLNQVNQIVNISQYESIKVLLFGGPRSLVSQYEFLKDELIESNLSQFITYSHSGVELLVTYSNNILTLATLGVSNDGYAMIFGR